MARMTLTTQQTTATRWVPQRLTIVATILAAAMLLLMAAAQAGVNLPRVGTDAQDTPSVVSQSTEPIYFPGRPY